MSEEEVKKDYQVAIEVITIHEYTVSDVNSPEEAEAVAEAWFDDGELGSVDEQEILSTDSYPIDSKQENFN